CPKIAMRVRQVEARQAEGPTNHPTGCPRAGLHRPAGVGWCTRELTEGANMTVGAQGVDAAARPAPASELTAADRFMRRLLRVSDVDRKAADGAHTAFRTSVLVSAVRCLITYLAIPVLVPLVSFAGVVAAPIGIALCAVAVVNGVV